MTKRFRRGLVLFGLSALGVLAAASGTASAQVASCPFNVSGNATAKLSVDGVLLARYAQGVRGAALIANIAPSPSLASTEAFIAANVARLDVDGDGAFGASDATIISRYLAGYSQAAWATGITFAGNAQRIR